MKKLVVLFVLVFAVNLAFAQEPQEQLVPLPPPPETQVYNFVNVELTALVYETFINECKLDVVIEQGFIGRRFDLDGDFTCQQALDLAVRRAGGFLIQEGAKYRVVSQRTFQAMESARQQKQQRVARAPQQPAPPQRQEPAPKPAKIADTKGLISILGKSPVVVLKPQYLDENRGYGYFGGYVILGRGVYNGRHLGNLRDLERASPSIQNALKVKLEQLDANVIQGVTGSDERESRNLNRELGEGKNARTQVQETADYAVQANYAFGVSTQSLKYWDCREPERIASRTLGRDVGKVISLGCVYKNTSQKLDMKAVLYLEVIGANRQIVYTQKAERQFQVSQAQFKEIMGVGRSSATVLQGNDIAEGLVAEIFN